MCMQQSKLTATSNDELLNFFERAVTLDTKNGGGNGKSPFDKEQLKREILERMVQPAEAYKNP